MPPKPIAPTSNGPMRRRGKTLTGLPSGPCGTTSPREVERRLRAAVRRRSLPQLPLELVEHPVTRQHLRDAGVGLAALADRGEEFAVLQLDAVHRHRDLRDVDLLVLAGEEVVVARDVGAGVADVAEE